MINEEDSDKIQHIPKLKYSAPMPVMLIGPRAGVQSTRIGKRNER